MNHQWNEFYMISPITLNAANWNEEATECDIEIS